MAFHRVFIDTSGFFSLANSSDAYHHRCVEIVQNKENRFITSDWIVGETVNLFTARKKPQLIKHFFELIETSKAIEMAYVEPELFWESKKYLIKRLNQSFSFTDCTSFQIMHKLNLKKVLTTDHHFRVAGFVPLLM